MRSVQIQWRLRQVMAERGLFSTTDLQPLLAERGVVLSATQVYRLVTHTPERLNMQVLAAACDALGCSPDDLIGITVTEAPAGVAVAGGGGPLRPSRRALGAGASPARPTRVIVARDE